jgi:hypothetical protein
MAAKLHLIMHVPKCAGTSVEQHLHSHLGPKRFWITRKRSRSMPLSVLSRKYHAPSVPIENIAAVSGHFLGRSIEQMFPDRQIVRSAILREPQRQVLSLYNYRMMRYLKSGLKPYPFHYHLRSLPTNPVAHFILERWSELSWPQLAAMSSKRKVAELDRALATFDRVVDISEANDLIAWLSRDLGVPEQSSEHNTSREWEAVTGWQPLRLEDLSRADRAEMDERLQIDRYLWRRWARAEDVAWSGSSEGSFLLSELARPHYQVLRRLRRGRY